MANQRTWAPWRLAYVKDAAKATGFWVILAGTVVLPVGMVAYFRRRGRL